ncbi:Mitochondrial inner membrane protease subunit 1 [Pichia kudriavzevii]|uniref:Mitochondrial inner membrane protease subunit n=1 Tax=Pichia kudriavzevii TaxID=4909 RepID=A0A1V2LMJ1_PICKU|nr:Mitochondrial inner membrane protease subunit 1 [Pichia kudriavzevii]
MSSIIKDLTRIASLSIRSIAALHLFTSSCYEISQTEGASMLPTLQVHNDFCVVDKHYKNGNDIQMGDLIVARKPTQPDSWVCKRITGMPGDVVLLDPSRDNIELKVEKGWDRDPYDMYIIVPDGHVWVTGDNLSDSVDSRTYSVIPMGLIAGKIIIGMYLPNLMRFKGNYYRWLENTFTDC